MPRHIRIVLVEPSHPGNIGAAARAMKTMSLDALVLVRPARFPDAEANARASGALDVLRLARVVATLDEALQGCTLVAGTSARPRDLGPPPLTPHACAAMLRQTPPDVDVALLFGRERTGLTNEELERCHFLVHIPANPEYSSLNLAAAVQILAYELLLARGSTSAATEGDALPASVEDMEGLYAHLESAAVAAGFLDPQHPKHLMRRLRHLFNRAQPDPREINILRGLLTALQRTRHG
ncbi:MAG: RNA methyltransferase [Gammaproteobacteria bacterium]|nr:RNA methyltransferase [Gammaproteobacteria bacterium]MDE1887414.1 RNA methyltransferase [Gammaproteobacteria bacterium]MDE2022807.1 RNA methyltransferase [Gammaproteobacteria bacterium]MDE2139781.1 RNA methyltransferase [Gammaproteobacteria bacterium]MDE2273481.1 RNA methyltransferase [Gammaproteobacteria bacterium]